MFILRSGEHKKGEVKGMSKSVPWSDKAWVEGPVPVKEKEWKKEEKKEGVQQVAWKRYYSKFMLFWAVAAYLWLVIQAYELYSSKDATGLSLAAFIFYIFGSCVWFTYGTFVLPERNLAIMISSITSFTLGSVIIAGIVLYKNGPPKKETT